jgi:hypothetical protein
MQFLKLHLSLIALAPIAMAAAVPSSDATDILDGEASNKTLVARSDHSAYAYAGRDCTIYDDARYDFECGKGCWPTADGWSSIFLQYSGSGAKPTADCFASSDCTGTRVSHNGIENEHTSGCSNQPRQVHSCYLYFKC